jgi:hypothetical protein
MPRRRAPWPLENHHLHRLSASRPDRCAQGPRRPDERRRLSRYVEQALVSELRPRDIVIMDNLPAHESMASDRRSRPPARACATCPLTAPTSIPSKWPSPSSRLHCAPPKREPSPTSGKPSPTPFAASPRKNAPTISPPHDTMQREWKRREGTAGRGWLPSRQRRGSDREYADRLTDRARVGSPSSFPLA